MDLIDRWGCSDPIERFFEQHGALVGSHETPVKHLEKTQPSGELPSLAVGHLWQKSPSLGENQRQLQRDGRRVHEETVAVEFQRIRKRFPVDGPQLLESIDDLLKQRTDLVVVVSEIDRRFPTTNDKVLSGMATAVIRNLQSIRLLQMARFITFFFNQLRIQQMLKATEALVTGFHQMLHPIFSVGAGDRMARVACWITEAPIRRELPKNVLPEASPCKPGPSLRRAQHSNTCLT